MFQLQLKEQQSSTCIANKDISTQLMTIYRTLLAHYGPRGWWPAKFRFEIIAGAILAQNVSWKNAKIAVKNLNKAGLLSAYPIVNAPHKKVASLIKASRFYNQKAEKLKEFCKYLIRKYDASLNKMFANDTETLRNELLALKGIGEETADSILLYAGNKLSFVSDAYTKRFLERYGLLHNQLTYDEIRTFFMKNLPRDISLYNEYHALIVHHCYAVCKSQPNCAVCAARKIDKQNYCRLGMKS